MRLSRNAHYAIRTVIDLALRARGISAEIARRQGIPQAYMAKVVHELSRAGILRTYRGTRGGVALAKAAGAVTLRDVVEATEGPIALNLCVVWGDCPCPQPCPVRASLAQLQTAMEREMEAITVEQLAQRVPAGWPFPEAAPWPRLQ
jgi:Rrf2 family protein